MGGSNVAIAIATSGPSACLTAPRAPSSSAGLGPLVDGREGSSSMVPRRLTTSWPLPSRALKLTHSSRGSSTGSIETIAHQ